MRFQARRTVVPALLLGAFALTLGGCKKNSGLESNNAEFANRYDKHHYDDMVTDEKYQNYEDQGAAISPQELEFIQMTIEEYSGDFEHCLETEMERLENRWVAGHFSVEFKINTSGQVSDVTVHENEVIERRTLNKEGQYVSEGGAAPRKAENFSKCVHDKLLDWEFDPPPETEYDHTYNGEVGEAW